MFFFKLLTELQKACGKGQLASCLFARKKKKVVYVTERNINKNHCRRKLLDPSNCHIVYTETYVTFINNTEEIFNRNTPIDGLLLEMVLLCSTWHLL